jgi:hypothetical protein
VTIGSGRWELWCDAVTTTDAGSSLNAYLWAEVDGLAQTTASCAGSLPQLTSAFVMYSNGTEFNTYTGGDSNTTTVSNQSATSSLSTTGCLEAGPFETAPSGSGNVWIAGWLSEPTTTGGGESCVPTEATAADGGPAGAAELLGFDYVWP